MTIVQNRPPNSPRLETRVVPGKYALPLTVADMPAHEIPDAPSDNFVICLALRGHVATEFRFGEAWRETVVRPGTFTPITPPHVLGEFRFAAPHRHLILTLPAAALTEHAGARATLGRLHEAPFQDPLLAQLCRSLWEETAPDHPPDPLYGDCARTMLIASLVRRAGRDRRTATAPLSGPQWERVLAFIEDRLDSPLSVAELAAAAGCSGTRLLRGFKARIGQSPYRYILNRRLERARTLLLNTPLPLAEISLRAGFYDQAHFANAFARQFGLSPGQLRRHAAN